MFFRYNLNLQTFKKNRNKLILNLKTPISFDLFIKKNIFLLKNKKISNFKVKTKLKFLINKFRIANNRSLVNLGEVINFIKKIKISDMKGLHTLVLSNLKKYFYLKKYIENLKTVSCLKQIFYFKKNIKDVYLLVHLNAFILAQNFLTLSSAN